MSSCVIGARALLPHLQPRFSSVMLFSWKKEARPHGDLLREVDHGQVEQVDEVERGGRRNAER